MEPHSPVKILIYCLLLGPLLRIHLALITNVCLLGPDSIIFLLTTTSLLLPR